MCDCNSDYIPVSEDDDINRYIARSKCRKCLQNLEGTKYRNNMSQKMMVSKMIQNRRSMSYHNSNVSMIYNKLIYRDSDVHRSLIFSLGYDVYTRYIKRIINNNSISFKQKQHVSYQSELAISELSNNDKINLGIIINESLVSEITAEDFLDKIDKIFYVTVYKFGIQYSFIIKNFTKGFLFVPEKVYYFDLSDPSNFGHKFSLSITDNFIALPSTYYSNDKPPGTEGSFMIYAPTEIDNYYTFLIFNNVDGTYEPVKVMDTPFSSENYTIYGYIYNPVILKMNYKNETKGSTLNENYIRINCLGQNNIFTVTESKGPKILIGDEETIKRSSLISLYNRQVKYGFYYGTYLLTVPFNYRFTILNKNKEDLIVIEGNEYEEDYVIGTDYDGSYNFYYGDIKIIVYGDFGLLSIYTKQFGFIEGDDMFIFSNSCDTYSRPYYDEGTIYDNINNLECLHNQTSFTINNDILRIGFNDKSDEDISNNTSLQYGLHDGQYMIFNIPRNNPIAFINYGKTEYFQYTGNSNFSYVSIGPDSQKYTFYYGTVIIYVYGDFGEISIYGFYNGYIGSYKIFKYSDICDFNSKWEPDSGFLDTSSNYISSEIGPITSTFINCFLNYSKLNIIQHSDGNEYIALNGDETYDQLKRYGLFDGNFDFSEADKATYLAKFNEYIDNNNESVNIENIPALMEDLGFSITQARLDEIINQENTYNSGEINFDRFLRIIKDFQGGVGIYVIEDIPEEYPICIVNFGKTDRIHYNGFFPYKSEGVGPDGFNYDFYYGNINLFIEGDFGNISIYVKNKGYMGGYKLLEYTDTCNYGVAIQSFSSISNNPFISTEYDEKEPQIYNINVTVQIIDSPYTEPYQVFILSGQDRTGVLSSSQQSKLTFLQGDTVNFYLDYEYSQNLLGIYENIEPIVDIQQVQNYISEETQQRVVSWRPVKVTDEYYYRAEGNLNFMFNGIIVNGNSNTELIPNIDLDASFITYLDSSNVSIYQNIILHFDDVVNIIPNGGSIRLINYDTDEELYSFSPSTDTNITVNTTNFYKTYTFDIANQVLEFDMSYSIFVDNNVFKNIYDNHFTGITDKELIRFSTEPSHPAYIINIDPSHNSTEQIIYFPINITFNEIVFINTGNVYFKNLTSGGSITTDITQYATGTGTNTITLLPSSVLEPGQTYSLQIEQGTFLDVSNVPYTGLNDDTFYNFSTVDTTTYDNNRPTLDKTNTYPSNNSLGNDNNIEFRLVFNEIVYWYEGFIYFYDVNVREILNEVIDVRSSTNVSGTGTTTLSFTISNNLTYGRTYTIMFTEKAIRNENYYFFNELLFENIIDYDVFDNIANTYRFTIKDSAINGPVLQSIVPTYDTSNVYIDSSFTLTFDENVYVNSGYVRLRNLNTIFDSLLFFDSNNDNTQLIGEGTKELTFSFTVDMIYDTSYSIYIDPSTFVDQEGNNFIDISLSGIYNFKTIPDIFPPVITLLDPINNGFLYNINNPIITLTFDQIAFINNSYNMYFKDLSENTIETIDLTDNIDQISGNGTNNIVITLNTQIVYDTSYTFYMDASAIVDDISLNAFTDFSNENIYSFKSILTEQSPTLLSISPNYNDTEVPNTNNYITMTFNRDVYVNLENSTSSYIYIERNEFDTIIKTIDVTNEMYRFSGNGTNTLTIDISDVLFFYDTEYSLYMTNDTISDIYRNYFTSIFERDIYNFTIQEEPTIIDNLTYNTISPANNSNNIDVTDNIQITFDYTIDFGEDNIYIQQLSDNTVFETINVIDNSDQLLISDSSMVLTIDLSGILTYDTSYSVWFDPSAIVSVEDNTSFFRDLSQSGIYVFRTETDTVTYTTECLQQDTSINIVSYNNSNYLVLNNGTSYNSGLSYGVNIGNYIIRNIPQEYPITILNSNTNGITVEPILETLNNIVIQVGGGSTVANSNGDYYTFTDEDSNSINIADGSFKFMRGFTYEFINNSSSSSHPFKIYINGSFTSEISTTGSIVITIPNDHSTTDGDLYYQCSNHASMKGNLSLTYNIVDETNENNNSYYDFYYGDLSFNITSDFSGNSVSLYSLNDGYMGGYNLLKYSSECSNILITCVSSSSVINIISNNGNKYVFNGGTTYDENVQFGMYNGTYNLTNISSEHPMAILNTNKTTNITYEVLDNTPILIKVSGGSTSSTNGDYYTFRDENDNSLQIGNGVFRFMRGRTYRFADYGISSSHPFIVFINNTNSSSISGGSNGTNYIDITIPSNHSTNTGDIYYQCTVHSSMKGNIQLLYKSVSETDESGNGSYDFYYGTIIVTVNSDFDEVSVYCYYHGYMGGKDLIKYSSNC